MLLWRLFSQFLKASVGPQLHVRMCPRAQGTCRVRILPPENKANYNHMVQIATRWFELQLQKPNEGQSTTGIRNRVKSQLTYTLVWLYTCLSTHMYVCMSLGTFVYIPLHTCIQTRTYKHAYMYTHISIHGPRRKARGWQHVYNGHNFCIVNSKERNPV